MFEQITILGPGLLGASLALALKERQLTKRVHSWSRRAETRALAQESGWCDAVFDQAGEACIGSQLVVICTPVDTLVPLLKEVAPRLDPETLITDVGSTKSQICSEAKEVSLNGPCFIGSHPMAGSEQTGMAHARADLFDGAACIVTPNSQDAADQITSLIRVWEKVGMRVFTFSPEKHDEIVAHISHLPHLLASALSSYLEEKGSDWTSLAGGGLRDTTRVAAGDPTLWKQILEQNREELLRAIEGFEGELHSMKQALQNNETSNLVTHLERGKNFRRQLN